MTFPASPDDTIFALSTPPGRSGVAVIRASGKEVRQLLTQMAGKIPVPRVAELVVLRHPQSHTALDRALIIYFQAPNSFTGEEVVEFHTHGGRAVVASVLSALGAIPGLRPAEPGEFTRRAFDNGKMALTEIEGLADLIHADTEAQRRQALRQMEGELGRLYEGWRGQLLHNLAHLEAFLDFPDEDIDPKTMGQLQDSVKQIQTEIKAHLADNRRGEKLREGLYAAIIGPPNAGKSSLLNQLARREAAIVTEQAGTTRDIIEIGLDLGGWPITLADTAGLRETEDRIEQEGVRRAKRAAEQADLKILVLDATAPQSWRDPAFARLAENHCMIVLNKADLTPDNAQKSVAIAKELFPAALTIIPVSSQNAYNILELLNFIERQAAHILGGGETTAITRLRHRLALESASDAATRFVVAALPELAAEELRAATHALGSITGRVDVEEVLDVVFGEFCIGK